METWKDIKGFEGHYQVSSIGNVKNIRTNSPLKKCKENSGYYVVYLSKVGKSKRFFIHRLIAESFVENKENKPFVNHIDGNKENNDISNLEWVTTAENNSHSVRTGLNDCRCGIALLENGEEKIRFNSITEAAKYFGVGKTTIFSQLRYCKHKYKKTKDIKWVIIKPPYASKLEKGTL